MRNKMIITLEAFNHKDELISSVCIDKNIFNNRPLLRDILVKRACDYLAMDIIEKYKNHKP